MNTGFGLEDVMNAMDDRDESRTREREREREGNPCWWHDMSIYTYIYISTNFWYSKI